MDKKRILVTGGTGYIGSHTVVELMERGFDVLIADNLSNSYPQVLDSIEKITGRRPEFAKADIADAGDTRALFSSYSIDGIIHFAAFKAVGESVEKPLKYYRNNLVSLISLVEAALEAGVSNLVFSSSCSVYGEPDSVPVSEANAVKKAESPYANTKQISEEILNDISKASPLKVIALRYFNPVGAHASALIGEYPIGKPSNLVPVITQTAIGKRDYMQVFGTDYSTPDGTCIRDYIHVVDVAKAHINALELLMNSSKTSSWEVFNLGTGKGSSVLEIIKAFEKVSGSNLNYKLAARRPGDVEKVYADTTLANRALGWKAAYSLDEMLDSAWKWELALNKNGSN